MSVQRRIAVDALRWLAGRADANGNVLVPTEDDDGVRTYRPASLFNADESETLIDLWIERGPVDIR